MHTTRTVRLASYEYITSNGEAGFTRRQLASHLGDKFPRHSVDVDMLLWQFGQLGAVKNVGGVYYATLSNLNTTT